MPEMTGNVLTPPPKTGAISRASSEKKDYGELESVTTKEKFKFTGKGFVKDEPVWFKPDEKKPGWAKDVRKRE